MTETFYPVSPDIPKIGVCVVVILAGRQFEAARAVDKSTRTVRWVEERDGKLWWFDDEPNCWRPKRPDLWKAPLPEALPPVRAAATPTLRERGPEVGRNPNRYAGMSAQADASDRARAELVAEFGEIEDGPPTSDRLWWLTERLTYSPRGEIGEREAEGRIARAILTDGIRGSCGGPQPLRQTSSALSQFIHSSLHSTDAEDMIEAFAPTPRDLSDYVTAFGWFAALAPYKRAAEAQRWEISHRQKVLVWRITGSSWRRLASLAGGSHTGAKKVYGGIIAEVTRIANSPPIDWTADVRERNRKARAEG